MGLCKDGYWREYERYEGKVYTGCGKDQKAALKSLMAKIEAAKSGLTVLNSNTLVKAWATTWLETYVKHTDMTAKSYSNIQGKINKNILPQIGTMKLQDVKDTHLQKILNAQEGKSKSHVTHLRSIMNQMFSRAVKSRLIVVNPAADLELPKATNNKRRSLTPAERKATLKTAETHYAGLWVKTILYCGLRPGETAALQWKDIDFKKKVINVHQALESGTTDSIKAPKTDAGYRIVPIPAKVLSEQTHLLEEFKAKKGKPLDYVFTQVLPANKGKHHTESSLRSYWHNFKRQLDIDMGAEVKRNKVIRSKVSPDLKPYILRHTYCTDLQKAGVPINVAKYLMGHSDISVTANIYTHEDDETVKMAAGIINGSSKKVSKKVK